MCKRYPSCGTYRLDSDRCVSVTLSGSYQSGRVVASRDGLLEESANGLMVYPTATVAIMYCYLGKHQVECIILTTVRYVVYIQFCVHPFVVPSYYGPRPSPRIRANPTMLDGLVWILAQRRQYKAVFISVRRRVVEREAS